MNNSKTANAFREPVIDDLPKVSWVENRHIMTSPLDETRKDYYFEQLKQLDFDLKLCEEGSELLWFNVYMYRELCEEFYRECEIEGVLDGYYIGPYFGGYLNNGSVEVGDVNGEAEPISKEESQARQRDESGDGKKIAWSNVEDLAAIELSDEYTYIGKVRHSLVDGKPEYEHADSMDVDQSAEDS